LRGAAALDDQYRRWSPPGWIKTSDQELQGSKVSAVSHKAVEAGAPLCRIIPHADCSVKRRIVCLAVFFANARRMVAWQNVAFIPRNGQITFRGCGFTGFGPKANAANQAPSDRSTIYFSHFFAETPNGPLPASSPRHRKAGRARIKLPIFRAKSALARVFETGYSPACARERKRGSLPPLTIASTSLRHPPTLSQRFSSDSFASE
jgi:hypothetical protein